MIAAIRNYTVYSELSMLSLNGILLHTPELCLNLCMSLCMKYLLLLRAERFSYWHLEICCDYSKAHTYNLPTTQVQTIIYLDEYNGALILCQMAGATESARYYPNLFLLKKRFSEPLSIRTRKKQFHL